MTTIRKGTRKALDMICDLGRNREQTDIYDAYERPSRRKVETFNEIKMRAFATDGYNHDLHVCGHNTSTYSTIYSFTQDGRTFAVKDTKSYTYITEIETALD